jgi:hypothetical protein
MMNKIHDVRSIKAETDFLIIEVDGHSYQIRWEACSPRLAKATPAQRNNFDVSPSGYGIHWPDIDEDLAITPLIQQAGSKVSLAKA